MKKIFIIDDDPDIVSILQMIFISNNYQVLTCEILTNVASEISNYLPDLIILDVFLDKFDGRDIAKQIRNSKNGVAKTPILIMSGQANPEIVKQCGANDFISKPFNIDEMINKVKYLLNPSPKYSQTS